MDNLGFPKYIYLLVFEARDGSGLKSAGEVKEEEFGSLFVCVFVLFFNLKT